MIGDFQGQHQKLNALSEISNYVVKHVYATREFAAFITDTDEAYVFNSSYEAVKLPQKHKIKSLMLKRNSCWGVGLRNLNDVFIYHWKDSNNSSELTNWNALVYKVNPRYRSPHLSGSILTAEYDMNDEEYEELGTLIGKHNPSIRTSNLKLSLCQKTTVDNASLSPLVMERYEKITNLMKQARKCVLIKCWQKVYNYRVRIFTLKYFCFQKPQVNLFKIDLAPKRSLNTKTTGYRSKSLSLNYETINPTELTIQALQPITSVNLAISIDHTELNIQAQQPISSGNLAISIDHTELNIQPISSGNLSIHIQPILDQIYKPKVKEYISIETQTDSCIKISRVSSPIPCRSPTHSPIHSPTHSHTPSPSPTRLVTVPQPRYLQKSPKEQARTALELDNPIYPIDIRLRNMLDELSPRYNGLSYKKVQVNGLQTSRSLKYLYKTMPNSSLFRNTYDRFLKKNQPELNPWRSPGSSSTVHSKSINKIQRAKDYSNKIRNRKRSCIESARQTFNNFDKKLIRQTQDKLFTNSSNEDKSLKYVRGADKLVTVSKKQELSSKAGVFKVLMSYHNSIIDEEREIERKVELYIQAIAKMWYFCRKIQLGNMKWAIGRMVK